MERYCNNCGNKLRDTAKYCGKCGTKADDIPTKNSDFASEEKLKNNIDDKGKNFIESAANIKNNIKSDNRKYNDIKVIRIVIVVLAVIILIMAVLFRAGVFKTSAERDGYYSPYSLCIEFQNAISESYMPYEGYKI